MRLRAFQIVRCFGFVDSGKINLTEQGNLWYFLGRNSSGKTSVLRAVSNFGFGQIPSRHPNFDNYETLEGLSFVRGWFSVDPAGDDHPSVNALVRSLSQRFSGTHLRIQQDEDGFSAVPSNRQASPRSVELMEGIREVYSTLLEQMSEAGEVLVGKLGDGTYQFFPQGNTPAGEFERRRDRINGLTRNLRQAFQQDGQQYPAGLDFASIESQLFEQFPDIFVFTDRFSLDEDLPRSLRTEHLDRQQNDLTEAFISLLGRQMLRDLMRASGRTRIESLRQELQDKLDALCNTINEDAQRGAADADFLRIYVDRADAVRIVLTVDGKESYYEHLSDNTKFLVAYHVFHENSAQENHTPSILLFDEPSKGFHPSAETKVLKFLQTLAERGNQVLVTTHSQHMIDLDRLPAVKIMARAEDGTLRVDNRLYGASGASRDTLALQPITDAIGLRYANQLVVQDKVVVVEGYTELLYLRLFARLLGNDEPNLAPVTGENKILAFLPFLISQGVSFKVVLDSRRVKTRIQDAIPVMDGSFFVVSERLSIGPGRSAGVEDLISEQDFRMLLERCGHEVDERHFDNVPNNEYARSTGVKALVAQNAYESTDLTIGHFSDETIEHFRELLSFCENGQWFRV